MKRFNFLLLLVSFFIAFSACKKEEIFRYDNSNKSNVYFSSAYFEKKNSEYLGVAYLPLDVDTVRFSLLVQAVGAPVDYDRPYELLIDEEISTLVEDVDFIFEHDRRIPAGSVNDQLTILFIRGENMKNRSGELILKLLPNDHFKTDIIQDIRDDRMTYVDYGIVLDNSISSPPPFWVKYASFVQSYLGGFSAKKFQLMIQELNLNVDEVTSESFQPSLVISWANIMQSYLVEQRLAGTPVYEEDGITLMTMGSAIKN